MALTKQIAKYIHPVLKSYGFSKVNHLWRYESKGFYFVVAVGSSKHGETQWNLCLELGVFSIEIEELCCARTALETPMSHMPGGIPMCHFVTSLYQVDEDLNWDEEQGSVRFFLRDTDTSEEFLAIAEKLKVVLPRFIEKFSSVGVLVDCRKNGIGAWTKATESKLQAAAGCIILGRFDQAEEFIKSAIKVGSAPVMKETARRLQSLVEGKSAHRG